MREFIYNSWNAVMDAKYNPLRNTPIGIKHMLMQVLAWMWCVIFSLSVGSYMVFGISAIAHALLIAGIVATVTTFSTYGEGFKFRKGYHSYGRSRGFLYMNGQKIKLDPNDPGGEHE